MVIAAPATMEEGRILLLGNETDILHSAFTFPLSEGGKRYPSADHYAHAQILTQLGLDEVHVLALLATTSSNVSKKAKELLQENMPSGHDMNSLSQYLTVSRQSYTMMGLRLRAEQDKRFRHTLMETGDALLIVCDRRDSELGIGMDDEYFVQFSRRHHANAERISAWMHDDRQRPKEIGQNQLGFFLMWLRYELREKEKAKWLSTVEIKDEGIPTDQEDNFVPISFSNFVLSLQGPFQPLSNYYAFTFEMKGCYYRSVEHYVYQRLFEALHLSEDEIMKIRTTVKPVDVSKMAKRLFKRLNIDASELEHKSTRLDRWRQSAMKYKITKNDYLQKLLLSTGNAFLIETTTEADTQWACGTDEFEYQHLLSKKYITPQLLLQWQCGREHRPPALSHFGGNKSGLILMELRTKLASQTIHRIPLITPLASSVLRSSVSNHMICFSPESVLHPFYPVDIKDDESSAVFPSAAHLAAQEAIEFLDISESNAVWIMEPREGPECWERLHTVICDYMQLPLEIIQQWYQEERQNVLKRSMKMQFEQHPMLLRVLLDTQDALLISCSRFSSVEAELHIGVRERDLRLWLSHVQQDTKQLMDICLRPMAFRPPFIGGNRLGFLLMELRREFILSGVFPHQLPEMNQNVDILLGSESPMENYAVTAPFSILDEINFVAIWANPYLLMLKQQLEEEESSRSESSEFLSEQWEKAAMSKKQPAMLISRDEPQINAFFERLFIGNQTKENDVPIENGTKINGICHPQTDLPSIDEMPIEILRSIYIKMAAQFRVKLVEMDDLQREIVVRSRDSSRLQDLRRTLEHNRENMNTVSVWSFQENRSKILLKSKTKYNYKRRYIGTKKYFRRRKWIPPNRTEHFTNPYRYKNINKGNSNSQKAFKLTSLENLGIKQKQEDQNKPSTEMQKAIEECDELVIQEEEEEDNSLTLNLQDEGEEYNEGKKICEKETPTTAIANLTMPPPSLFQTQSSSISVVSQPPPQLSLASSQFSSISSQQPQSSAQWTQAAAMSASNGRRPSPAKGNEFLLTNNGGQFQQKIPSLLPELIMSANAPSLPLTGPPPNFSAQRSGPLPPQLSTTQIYSGARREHQQSSQFPDNRSRWADRSGRRGGGSSRRFGGIQRSEHSESPPSSSQSFSSRRRARTPPSHRRTTPISQHKTQQREQQLDTNATSEVPPPEKKTKRVVDESELSEGEILSDEE